MALPILASGALLSAVIVPLVIKVMVALGVGFVTYNGLSIAMDSAFNLISNQLGQMPVEQLSLLAIMNVDKYLTMVFSAYSAKLVLVGMNASGSITRMNLKGVAP